MSCRGRVLAIVAVLSLVLGLFIWPGPHGGQAGAAGTPALFEGVAPARLLDSRSGESTVDGLLAGIGVRGGRSVTEVLVAGRGGVPVDAVAVVLNVTVVGALGAGFVTVWPCGATMPLASNLNFVAGQVVPNAVLSKVGVGGKVCVFSSAATDLVVDVNGYFLAGSSFGSLAPARLLDSRSGESTVDGLLAGIGVRGGRSVTEVLVAGRGGVPVDAVAVVLNVTVVGALGAGFVTVWPCGATMPLASNLNFVAGQVVPNAVLSKVGVGGKVCVFSSAATDLVVDVNGYFPAQSTPPPSSTTTTSTPTSSTSTPTTATTTTTLTPTTTTAPPPPPPVQKVTLAAGDRHTCAVLTNGTARCWGSNDHGQLGNGNVSPVVSTTAVTVTGLTGVLAIAAGAFHTCALRTDRTVWCWGLNAAGQLGDGTTNNASSPVQVSGVAGAIAIGAGAVHTCALLADRTMTCWGSNSWGKLGRQDPNDQTLVAQPVAGLAGVRTISLGANHTCASLVDGTARCWGYNVSGQLGSGSTNPSPLPISVVGLDGVVSVTAGATHTCALLTDGTVRCWGHGELGELGDAAFASSSRPVIVAGLGGATAIAAGQFHTCARVPTGVRCWGHNNRGQLGNGTTSPVGTNVAVSIVGSTAAITAGGSHSCALLSNGSAQCWGDNSDGQLGSGTTSRSATLVHAGLIGVSAVGAGGQFSCALAGGTVRCWGANELGQLANGTTTDADTPVSVSGLSGVTAIAVGGEHACALLQDATVRCWGANYAGQLGAGTGNGYVPVVVGGLTGVTAISAGWAHTCALVGGALPSVKCWGANDRGQLGNGTTANSTTPVTVSGLLLAGPVGIAAGYHHSCVRLGSGGVKCWGENAHGELGNGSSTISFTTPTDVIDIDGVGPLANVSAVAPGISATCAIVGGSGYCWGDNTYGQLGNGTSAGSRQPVAVQGLSGVVSIDTDGWQGCALLTDHSVRCWGVNSEGQLGNGTFQTATTPVTVLGLTTATAVAAGTYHSCALVDTGAVWCWGLNDHGQLANGPWYPTARAAAVNTIAMP